MDLWRDGMNRELEEESGVKTRSLQQVGLLVFEFIGDPQLLEVHVFSTEEFAGTVAETEGQHLPYNANHICCRTDNKALFSFSKVCIISVYCSLPFVFLYYT